MVKEQAMNIKARVEETFVSAVLLKLKLGQKELKTLKKVMDFFERYQGTLFHII